MPKGWINKTISFKESDPADNARYRFAVALPNCTSDFKCLIDQMMVGNYKSFNQWLESRVTHGALVVSHEFKGIEENEESEEADLVEADCGQFL